MVWCNIEDGIPYIPLLLASTLFFQHFPVSKTDCIPTILMSFHLLTLLTKENLLFPRNTQCFSSTYIFLSDNFYTHEYYCTFFLPSVVLLHCLHFQNCPLVFFECSNLHWSYKRIIKNNWEGN